MHNVHDKRSAPIQVFNPIVIIAAYFFYFQTSPLSDFTQRREDAKK